MHILVISKRQYTNKDLIDDRYGRLWEIPAALAQEGHEVTGVCLSYRPKNSGLVTDEKYPGGVMRWHSINAGLLYLFGLVRFLWTVRRIMKSHKPDVVWSCSDTFYGIVGYYLAKLYGSRSVIDLYDNFESFASYRVPLLRGLFRRAVRKSDGLSCVSENLQNHIRSSYRRDKSIAVITNAVDTEKFHAMDKTECRRKLGLPLDKILIGSAGDLSIHRGADIMIRAITEPGALGDVELAIAGPRTADTTIPRSDRIHDLGALPADQVPLLFNALDVAVVYNRSSLFGDYCFPQKLYEILACGTPIIAADVGVMHTLLQHKPELLYAENDPADFIRVAQQQLQLRSAAELPVPTWGDQAQRLRQYFTTVSPDGR